ncbi:MAG: thioredoxin family protein [Pseudomonadota bacterium]
MKNSFFLVLVLQFLLVPAIAATNNDIGDFFDDSLGDYQEELEVAKEENKQAIMLFFEMDECPFCHWMKTNVLNQSSVHSYFKKHFKIFSIDIEGDVEITDFKGETTTEKDFAFKQFRVRATPVIAFFDLNGKLLTKFTGRTSSSKEFNLLGEYVISGSYKKMKFSKYKRKNR